MRMMAKAFFRVAGMLIILVFAPVERAYAASANPSREQPASLLSALAAGRFSQDALGRLMGEGYAMFPAKVLWYGDGPTPPNRFYVNNPLTTYGGIAIPLDQSEGGSGFSDIFEMDGDAAIALYGITPPRITYYSFTMNEFARYRPATKKYIETNSSIALSVNNENIVTNGSLIYNDFFVLVIAAQFKAAQVASDFFISQGVPAQSINTMLVPNQFTKQSRDKPSKLNFLTRLTYRTPAEKDAVLRYVRQDVPPLTALYFKKGTGAKGDVEDADLVKWEDLLRDDLSEFAGDTRAQLDLLSNRVLQHYTDRGYEVKDQGTEYLHHTDPDSGCRDAWHTCYYDAPDALYGRFLCEEQAMPTSPPKYCIGAMPDGDSRAVIVGVNHHHFGQGELMTYFSYAVTRLSDLQGVVTLADLNVEGSADPFLSDLENKKHFFVITVGRECNGDPFCLEIPYFDTEDSPGLPKFGQVFIASRIYLDKIMATGPNPDNFLPARLFWLKKRPR
jgi:hypothetical protein